MALVEGGRPELALPALYEAAPRGGEDQCPADGQPDRTASVATGGKSIDTDFSYQRQADRSRSSASSAGRRIMRSVYNSVVLATARFSLFRAGKKKKGRLSSSFGTTIGFTLAVCSASSLVSALAYVALPASNPLQDGHRSEWWHCLVPCGLVWAPLTIVFYCALLRDFLYERYDAKLHLQSVLLLYVSGAVSIVCVEYVLMHYWMRLPVLNGVILAVSNYLAYGCILMFHLVPWLGTEIGIEWTSRLPFPSNPLWKLQARASFLIFFSLVACLQLAMMLVYCAWLMWLDMPYVSVTALTCVRAAVGNFQERTAGKLDKGDGWLVGINLAILTTGVAGVLTVGFSQDWGATALFFLSDVGFVFLRVLSLADLQVRGAKISQVMLDKALFLRKAWRSGSLLAAARQDLDPEYRVERCRHQIVHIIASELGEVILPLSYTLCWLVVRAGPNRAAFSGVGTSDFGLQAPKDLGFLPHTGALILLNVVSLQLVKLALSRLCRVDIEWEARKVFRSHGPVLLCQAVWLVMTAFCMTMIQCGLDFNLQYHYLETPAGVP